MRDRTAQSVLVCGILCGLAIAYVDRPLALALDRAYRHSATWVVVDRAFYAVEPLFLLIAVAGAALSFSDRGRRKTSGWAGDLRGVAIAGAVALLAAALLKVLFGRSGPDLTFVRDGVYEFRWFTGTWTPHHGAFPSATAAATSAMAAMLWLRRSRLRFAGVVIASLLSVVVVIQQYHWLSDAVGGVGLGVVTADVVHMQVSRRRLDQTIGAAVVDV